LRLTIFGKPGCHLCDEMKAVVHRVLESHADLPLDEIDVSAEPALLDRYGLEVPVLLIDGTKVAKYRITEKELTRILDSRARGKG
jgi:glutaredoxin